MAATEADPDVSRDALLDGRVVLFQPASGYRVAIDPVLLAAAVPARSGDTVLDVGSGSGAAALALAARVPGARVVGLEAKPDLIALARLSAEASGLAARVRFVAGDLLEPPPALSPAAFDHVMANPPYRAADHGSPPADEAKRTASVEGRARLADWLRFALAMVKPGGSVTVIHRFDRKDEVIAGLAAGGAGDIAVLPLWPSEAGRDARRAIVRAVRGGRGATATTPGLVLHAAEGGYTAAAEAILRDARPLRF